ncbi:MAG: pro-sigmaK processing inhibitor BofA family protein [Firmicutes bacterium]|nr:pro-sigmaK processing inhibitor BofA family protein [Bacillota bacterium]
MDKLLVVGVAAGAVVAILLVRALLRHPSRIAIAVLRNLLQGAIAFVAIDYFGKAVAIHVPINWVSAAVATVLGAPGIAALAVIDKWIV